MITKYLLYTEPPLDFLPTVEVAACYCEWNSKFLFLLRHSTRPQGNTWGLPAGKLEKGETPAIGMLRELEEETGIVEKEIKEIGKLFIRLEHVDYIYHMFHKKFTECPTVKLSDEHTEIRWMSLEDLDTYQMIAGTKEAFLHFIKIKERMGKNGK
jgi:8-oxo-dGTP pyrophosphatase MutT (NUDIX family)